MTKPEITSLLLYPASLWQTLIGWVMNVSIITVWGMGQEEIEQIKRIVDRAAGQ